MGIYGKRKRIGRWKNRKVDMTLCHIGLNHVRCVRGKAKGIEEGSYMVKTLTKISLPLSLLGGC